MKIQHVQIKPLNSEYIVIDDHIWYFKPWKIPTHFMPVIWPPPKLNLSNYTESDVIIRVLKKEEVDQFNGVSMDDINRTITRAFIDEL